MGEVHDPHDAVDEAEPAGDEEQGGCGQEGVENMDDQEIHQSPTRYGITFTSGFTRLSSTARATITRYSPGLSRPRRSTTSRGPSVARDTPAVPTSPPAPMTT